MSAKFIIPAITLSLATHLPALDLNTDGLCDVWQARHHAAALPPTTDHDGDGFTQQQEATAGTDPFDPSSRPTSGALTLGENQTSLQTPTLPGKSYQLLRAENLSGPWTPVGPPQLALDPSLDFTAPTSEDRSFFRIEIRDADTDGDGISDWAELQLEGFDRLSPDSFNTGTPSGDSTIATAMLQSLTNGQISATITTPSAFEKNNANAVITYTRTGPTTHPHTLFIHTRPDPDTRRSSPTTTRAFTRHHGSEIPAMGVHPSAPELANLFNTGKAAFVCNIGTLAYPVPSRSAYTSGSVPLPPQLYSHSDQQTQWQSSIPDRPFASGWGGRAADLLSGRGDGIAPVTPPTPPDMRVRIRRFQSDDGDRP